MIPTLDRLLEHEVLTSLDRRFATTLARIGGERSPEVLLAAAMVSGRVGQAHVCLDLRDLAGKPAHAPESGEAIGDLRWPTLDEWTRALRRSPLVDPDVFSPLVLDGPRLYLRRYHEHETELARRIGERVRARADDDVDRPLLRDGLRRLFPGAAAGPDWQRVAAALAVSRRFTVITGGPGTGKTWTVARVLALLVEQGLRRGRAPRIHLLAPTGKAAARLRESIRASRGDLEVAAAARAAIPDDASTIHRALGAGRDGGFRHGAGDPLVTDAVVVDEASMVDLALMSRLFAALPETARVILLGDRDQLASVEAGSVLADVCGARPGAFGPAVAAEIHDLAGDAVPVASGDPGLRDSVVELRESRRFRDHPAIGALAAAINAGDADGVLAALRDAPETEIALRDPSPSPEGLVAALARDGYAEALGASTPAARLDALGRFRVLCAHRRGREGVEGVNSAIEWMLAARGLLELSSPDYVHRPLLVTENDRATRLFNGDVGLVVRDGEGRKALFPSVEGDAGAFRLLSLARLPAHETAFALSVHKSQGSEFDHVVVVLPANESPVLTRELLYTAVTRARERVTILATAPILRRTVERQISRSSGLRERLWGTADSRPFY